MKAKMRERLAITVYLLFFIAAIVAECIPLLIFTVLLAAALYLVAAYVPEYKEKKQPRVRPIYTDWDACYRISQDLPY